MSGRGVRFFILVKQDIDEGFFQPAFAAVELDDGQVSQEEKVAVTPFSCTERTFQPG